MASSHHLNWIASVSAKLESLTEWNQRIILFGESVVALTPEDASSILEILIGKTFALRQTKDTVTTQSALLANIKGYWNEEHKTHTREAAASQEDELTLAFLVKFDPSVEIDLLQEEDSFPVPSYQNERPITLGERKTLATRPTRQTIEKALLDPDPMVATKLLDNPKLTENDIIRMAARRPSPPSILAQIASHTRWRTRQRVIVALAQNSYTPLPIGLSLLPFMHAADIKIIAEDKRLSQPLQNAAKVLLQSKKRQLF